MTTRFETDEQKKPRFSVESVHKKRGIVLCGLNWSAILQPMIVFKAVDGFLL